MFAECLDLVLQGFDTVLGSRTFEATELIFKAPLALNHFVDLLGGLLCVRVEGRYGPSGQHRQAGNQEKLPHEGGRDGEGKLGGLGFFGHDSILMPWVGPNAVISNLGRR